jgi:hypothetical protein
MVSILSGSSMSRGIKWFYSRVACRWCRVRRKLAEHEDQVGSEFTMRERGGGRGQEGLKFFTLFSALVFVQRPITYISCNHFYFENVN